MHPSECECKINKKIHEIRIISNKNKKFETVAYHYAAVSAITKFFDITVISGSLLYAL